MEKICKNCEYYRPHYIPWGDTYRRIPHGHCIHPRLKLRSEKQGCPHFRIKETPNPKPYRANNG